MAVDEWREYGNGRGFYETLHGPNVERVCVDCDATCFSVPRFPEPRCCKCGREHWGLSLAANTRSTISEKR